MKNWLFICYVLFAGVASAQMFNAPPPIVITKTSSGPVAFEAKSENAAINVSTISNSGLTITNGTLLVACIAWNGATPAGMSLTWNGVSLSLVPGSNVSLTGQASVSWYYLINPATGNHTLTASWTGLVADAKLCGVSFTGANLSGGTTTFPSVQVSSGLAMPPLIISGIGTQTGDATLGLFAWNNGMTSITSTILFIDNSGSITGAGAAYSTPGVSSFTMSGSSATAGYAASGIEISP